MLRLFEAFFVLEIIPIMLATALGWNPHDPQRYAPGVTVEQFAPGAAIDACEPAVKLNPDLARAWFELGRSYWEGRRDADAFRAFVEAAKRNYAAAMKYIGDAYLEGRGLPSGQQRDAQTALQWYKKSSAGGFRSEWAAKLYADVRSAIETGRHRSIRAIDAIRMSCGWDGNQPRWLLRRKASP